MSEPRDSPQLDTPSLITLAGDQDAQPAFTPATPASTRESVCPPTIDPGKEVGGRYRLGEEIARGGMGVVYAARDIVLDRDIGLKTLKQLPPDDSPDIRRFRGEARITGQLQHPGIPPVHDLGTFPDGRPFLAMKLIQGCTLEKLLKDRPDLSHDRGRFVATFERICQAVGYAHAHQVIHRDLKPSNVMVGAFGEVQVMDWGLAKVLTEARPTDPGPDDNTPGTEARSPLDPDDATRDGVAVGTAAYMPREQAIGAITQIDERSDVFGLGAILCAILTGHPPYEALTREDARQMAAVAMLGGAFARLDACGAEPELVGLCKRCLSAEKADRPRNGEEVAGAVAALRAAADERARRAEVERERAEVRAAEQRKRRRVQLALAAAVALLLAGGGAFAWWRDRQAAEQSLADERRMSAEFRAEAEAQNARSGVHALLAASTDLRKRYQFEDAAVALDQAELLTAKGAADLRPVVERAKADLALVRRLDDVRMKRSTWIAEPGGKGRFDLAGAVRDYPEAFRFAGLDVLGADPGAVAAAVAGSPVRAELVAALDDWSALPLDDSIRDRILGVLRRADPGPWLDAFRDPAVRNNPLRLWWLARSAAPARLPPATLTALAEVMWGRGLDPVPLLARAQFAHPGDFLIPFQLGLSAKAAADQVAHYQAARITRRWNVAVLINLGVALKDKGDVDGAIAAYKEAITHNPRYAKAHNGLGVILCDVKKDYDGAIAAFREAITHDPRYALAHYNLGVALKGKGDLDGAIAAYKEAITHDPTLASAHHNLGNALKDKGDVDGAITAYKEALTHDPRSASAHYNLGKALKGKGDLDGAITAYKEALKHDPRYAQAHHNLGNALKDKGDLDGAIAAHKEALTHDPTLAPAHNGLGVILCDVKKDYDGAIAAFREAIAHDPKFAQAHHNLGNALKGKGDLDGAIAAFREALTHDPTLTQAHINLGNALKGKGDLDGAITAYKEAIKHDPKDAYAHNNLGAVYLAQKKYPEAIACARAAIRADPQQSTTHALLGHLLQLTGDLPGARAALTEAARLDPRWKPLLAKLPPVPVAPPPRPVDR
jgi:tetratricopeptide (TPR) repeat protein